MSRRVVCANCGEWGHVFKECSHPIISCGVICRTTDESGEERFLVVQRKDSFAFVEFMRGKYNISNKKYLTQLFEGMTKDERYAISVMTFDALWKMLWNGFARAKSRPEYEDANKKFTKLRSGLRINGDRHDTNITWLLNNTCGRDSPEWGFPKGRRGVSNESDIDCALREMYEETGICKNQINIYTDKRYEETFRGNNGVNYMHVYFLADLVDTSACLKTCDREIKNASWVKEQDLINLISDSPTRVSVFNDVLIDIFSDRSQTSLK